MFTLNNIVSSYINAYQLPSHVGAKGCDDLVGDFGQFTEEHLDHFRQGTAKHPITNKNGSTCKISNVKTLV